jgi:flagellar assembly protein FliH
MSSKILSGEAAKAAVAINWARRNGPHAERVDQPAGANAGTTTTYRSHDHYTQLESRIAEAREAGRADAERALREEFSSRIDAVNARVARSVVELAAVKSSCRREAEQDVVKLAIAIARKILYREIAVDSEALLGLVKVALDKIEARELHRVRVHPQHVAGIQRALHSIGAPAQIEVHGDASLEHGAAVFETGRGALDASIETQLREIERGFTDLVARR